MPPGTAPNVFAHSLGLLARNLAIVVPGIAIGAIAALVGAALEPAQPLESTVWTRALQEITNVLASILAIAYTTGMADAAWRTGSAGFSDGTRAFKRDVGNVFVAMLVLFALGVAAALVAAFTFGLSLAIYVFFCVYTMAAAVVGERSGFRAVFESAEIAFLRPLTTLLVVAAIIAITFVLGALAELVSGAPLVGPLISEVVIQVVVAYLTLVVVGEYRTLRGVLENHTEVLPPSS
jgi:hypothetical protein